jgi:hypothetical protein
VSGGNSVVKELQYISVNNRKSFLEKNRLFEAVFHSPKFGLFIPL